MDFATGGLSSPDRSLIFPPLEKILWAPIAHDRHAECRLDSCLADVYNQVVAVNFVNVRCLWWLCKDRCKEIVKRSVWYCDWRRTASRLGCRHLHQFHPIRYQGAWVIDQFICPEKKQYRHWKGLQGRMQSLLEQVPVETMLVKTNDKIWKVGHMTPSRPLWPNFAFVLLLPLVVNLHAKFVVSSFNRFRDINGIPKFQK